MSFAPLQCTESMYNLDALSNRSRWQRKEVVTGINRFAGLGRFP